MKLLYENPLEKQSDVDSFIKEGELKVSFANGKMRLENMLDEALGQKSNFLFWCPKKFPSDIQIEWDFMPLSDSGLAMMFFCANGKNGIDLFDKSLHKRTGEYQQYHSSDINAFHASYFRRKLADERIFHTCNLRKSCGFHLVAQGADPIPSAIDAQKSPSMYHITIKKEQSNITFSINNLTIYTFIDDGKTYGNLLNGGYIGFRQMAPLVAEYSSLKVFAL